MAALPPARTGRERQRYSGHFRLVAGCIPYKLTQIDEADCGQDLTSRLQVLMISSPDRQDLVFPKGGWENDETEVEAAQREALEEAGVRGKIKGLVGVWELKSKSKQNDPSHIGSCRGSIFAMEVEEELLSWPEQALHQRRWVPFEEAKRYCRYMWMCEALDQFLVFVCNDNPSPSIVSPISPLRTTLLDSRSNCCRPIDFFGQILIQSSV